MVRARSLALAAFPLATCAALAPPADAQTWCRGTAQVEFVEVMPWFTSPLPLNSILQFEFAYDPTAPFVVDSYGPHLVLHAPAHISMLRLRGGLDVWIESDPDQELWAMVESIPTSDYLRVRSSDLLTEGIDTNLLEVIGVTVELVDADGPLVTDLNLPRNLDAFQLEEAELRIRFDVEPTGNPLVRARILTLERLIGAPFCQVPSVPVADQGQASLVGTGDPTGSATHFSLLAQGLPSGEPAMLLVSTGRRAPLSPPGLAGLFCLDASMHRWHETATTTTAAGTAGWALDLSVHPVTGIGGVAPGDTLCFQAWYRDTTVPQGSRTTHGLQVTFP